MNPLPKYATIGTRIRQLREIKGLNQSNFGKSLGISQMFVSDLEKGTTRPTETLLLAIEYVYKCRKEWIIHGDGEIWKFELDHPEVIDLGQASAKMIQYWTNKLKRIFAEGDKNKIDALKAQLRLLDSGEKELAKEKRSHPRISVTVPVEFQIMDQPESRSGMVINGSQMGCLIQASHDIPVGTKIHLKLTLPGMRAEDSFRASAEIMWKDKQRTDDTETYHYGVRFLEVLNEGHAKLDALINQSRAKQGK